MQDVRIGEKLYHWRYGALTVIGIGGSYIETKIDDVTGIVYLEGDSYNPHYNEPIKKFPKDSIGHWLFLDKNDILKENNIIDIKQGQFPQAMILPIDKKKLHFMFKEKIENVDIKHIANSNKVDIKPVDKSYIDIKKSKQSETNSQNKSIIKNSENLNENDIDIKPANKRD